MTKEQVKRAIYGSPDKPLRLGNMEIQCYVLEDETRVLSGRGMQEALGLGQAHGTLLKRFVGQTSLSPYINSDLAMDLQSPVRFIRPGRGGKPALAYEATVLTRLCDAVLEARKAGNLTESQMRIADQCELLMRGLATVGIIALVDAVTGFQEFRARRALEEIFEKFIAKELQPWTKTFPDEFYEHMFRLRGWPYDPSTVKRPQVIGHLTNDVIYSRLAPGVLVELRKKSPKDDKGRRHYHLHRWTTEDIGHPKLREHLASVITLMKVVPNKSWRKFMSMLNRALPKYGDTLSLGLGEPEEDLL